MQRANGSICHSSTVSSREICCENGQSTPGFKLVSRRWRLCNQRRRNTSTDASVRHAGKFILATNVLDTTELSDNNILCEYKAQQSTERGFRFLKDPLFFTSSVFLNSAERVAALAMVIGLCLLVYSLGQRALPQALKLAKQTISNQLSKPTATPTLRWVFQCFMSIHLLTLAGVKQITNLTDERRWILQFLGAPCQKYYLLT